MLPSIAAHAVTVYTTAGDLVADPMCGIGTTLVEAVHHGRDAVGVELEARCGPAPPPATPPPPANKVPTGAGMVIRGMPPSWRSHGTGGHQPSYGSNVHRLVRPGPGGITKSGWVTDIGLPRTEALRLLRNGVATQRAATALRTLLIVHAQRDKGLS